MRLRANLRGGATTVECAFVYPVTFLFVIGLMVGAMGMFRYQEMATLSREAARYASVHGTEYARTAKTTAPTPDEIYAATVTKMAVGLDLSKLSYSITYDTSNAPYRIDSAKADVSPYFNTVKVTLTYKWIPEAFLGSVNLTSTSEMTMSY